MVTPMMHGSIALKRMSSNRGSGGDDRRPGDSRLGGPGTAKNLRRALAAAARNEAEAMFDPGHELAEAAGMGQRFDRHGQERRCRRALELAPTHFAAEPAIDPPARYAGAHMGLRQPRLTFVSLTRRVGSNHPRTKLTHAARRRDSREPIQLRVGATDC
jgi:hypothetical protein